MNELRLQHLNNIRKLLYGLTNTGFYMPLSINEVETAIKTIKTDETRD